MLYDLVFCNAWILDGTGAAGHWGDVGVSGERIAYVGPRCPEPARRTIDAAGMAIAPGFIDMHTHSDLVLLAERDAGAKVMQGVTTEVIGQDGLSYAPLAEQTIHYFRATFQALNGDPPGLSWQWRSIGEYLAEFERGTAVNVAMLVPHGNVRSAAIGLENRRAAPSERAAMQALLRQGMAEGAIGLSTGLTYAPCSFADADELVALAAAAAEYGGYFAPHLRSYGADMEAAVDEAIDVARAAGASLHLTHFQAPFSVGRGKAALYLDRIGRARRNGLEVTLDAYPYLAGSTFLAGLLPGWTHEGGRDRVLERLSNHACRRRIRHEMEVTGSDGLHRVPVDWETLVVAGVRTSRNADLVGRNLAEAAVLRRRDPFDVFADLLIEEDLAVSCLAFIGNEENLQTFMRDPEFMAGSDGILVGDRPHPRAWGTFARYLARYVRELGVWTLEECVRKMTSLPARRLGLTDRGVLCPGAMADLVVFDPETVQDQATYEEPRRHPVGIPYVAVNGRLVKDADQPTGARPGQVIRGSGSRGSRTA
ncbi:MAG: D-aminoacylase [Thermoguttaceae bacterium]|nr:D-aminoacylase [Thermoguttaceae bacterium]